MKKVQDSILDIKELAEYLNCSVSTIRNLIRKGDIPFLRIGVKIFFRTSSIERWLDEKERR